MTLRLVPFATQRLVPWANGGGSTREVAIDPPGASLATGFRWRVSRAEVASDGPFSVLPGVDRSLWLLAGDGFVLAGTRQTLTLDRRFARLDFAGEELFHATLLGGPCEDLGVMVARAHVAVSAQLHELADGEHLDVPEAPQRLLLAIEGTFGVAGCGLDAGAGDAMRADGAGPLGIVAVTRAVVLAAAFTPRA